MIQSFTILLACQLAGEALVRATGAPLPGPVVGLVFLFVILLALGGNRDDSAGARSTMDGISTVSDGLLAMLGVLFVPAGVGVIQHFGLFRSNGVALFLTLVISLVITLAVTALAFAATTRLMRHRPHHHDGHENGGHGSDVHAG